MANFRQNQNRGSKSKGINSIKVILLVAILMAALWYLSSLMGSINIDMSSFDYKVPPATSQDSAYHLPAGSHGQIVHHKNYSLSYLEEHEQAEWVAYELTKESLRKPNVPRAKKFKKDLSITTGSAGYYDYRGTGYSRGHLAPAADMAFDQEAMQESFFMSNMSPQLSAFNGGVWNELENLVRDWSYKNKRLYVITGPILNKSKFEKIGKAKISVPEQFYKVLLDIDSRERKAIAFLLPNEKSERRISDFAVTVDSIEALTDLDFFAFLLDQDAQIELESQYDMTKWPLDEKLYQKRITSWNNR